MAQRARLTGLATYRGLCLLAQLLGFFQSLGRTWRLQPLAAGLDEAWAQRNDVTPDELPATSSRLGLARAALERVQALHGVEPDRSVATFLRVEGVYPRFRDSSLGGAVRRFLQSSPFREVFELVGACLGALRSWVQAETPVRWSQGTLESYARGFREVRGLRTAAATHGWLAENDLSPEGFGELVEMLTSVGILVYGGKGHLAGVFVAPDEACWFLDALRVSGAYTRLKARPCAGSLEEHFRAVGESPPQDLDGYARQLDFGEGREGPAASPDRTIR